MTLIYNGILTGEMQRMIEGAVRDGYGFAVEYDGFPDVSMIPERPTQMQSDLEEGNYIAMRRHLLWTQSPKETGFLWFKNKEDYDLLAKSGQSCIVNAAPFQTKIG